ncbi:TFIIH complex subunit TFB6 PWA37_002347 [Arxiozyma heterogenica]|uniref:Uncharacterized protein n=1 Tax=Arxiozyma heterogenica TaxID=278026 RepID=A0AAN7ZTB0_9SACH|nr:hypothetical protein RI543_000495 [Kazachstania heterogenica]
MEDISEDPKTPLHAKANEQLNLDNVNELDEKEIEDLDLNPTFDESLPPSTVPSRINLDNMNEPMPACLRMKRSINDAEDVTIAGENEYSLNTTSSPMFDNVEDFKPSINVTSPFSSSTLLQNKSSSVTTQRGRRLSMTQQSKFVSYVDQRFMDIQRKFVQSRGLNNENGYKKLSELLKDIKSLLDFIWYSIDNTSSTDFLLQEMGDATNDSNSLVSDDAINLDLMNDPNNKPLKNKSIFDFGQSSYVIKIADDVIDYIEKFEIEVEDNDTISKLFKLFFILDKIFAKLITGSNNNSIKLNRTDIVRFVGIAERSRVRLPLFFEHLNIHGFHYELSKIYETSLDLC